MIYTTANEIIILHTGDDQAVVHRTRDGVGVQTSIAVVVQWQKSLDMLIEAETTPALKLALEQAELLYELCRKR